MNLGQASAYFAAHKTVILGTGFAGAAVLGLRARSKSTAASSTDSTGTTTSTAAAPGDASTYDSTANDVYNALEPQLEALAGQLAVLQSGPTTTPTTTDSGTTTTPVTPSPTPVTQTPAPTHVAPGTSWGVTGQHYGQPAAATVPTSPTHYVGKW